MAKVKHPEQPRLFILKLWQEVLDEEPNDKRREWRGSIQDIFKRDTHYFRDWPTMVEFISCSLPELKHPKRRNSRSRLERTKPTRNNSTLAVGRRVPTRQ